MHLFFHSDPARSARFSAILCGLTEAALALRQASLAYDGKRSGEAVFLATGKPSKEQIAAYYHYTQALRVAADCFSVHIAELSAAMAEADRAVLPKFVELGDQILQEYLGFCREMNRFLEQSEAIIRSDESVSSEPSWGRLAKDFRLAEDRFLLFLTETAKRYGISPKIT